MEKLKEEKQEDPQIDPKDGNNLKMYNLFRLCLDI